MTGNPAQIRNCDSFAYMLLHGKLLRRAHQAMHDETGAPSPRGLMGAFAAPPAAALSKP